MNGSMSGTNTTRNPALKERVPEQSGTKVVPRNISSFTFVEDFFYKRSDNHD